MALTRCKNKHPVLLLAQRRLYSDVLRATRSGDQMSEQARFSAPIHTGPGTDISSYTMVAGSFYVVKRSARGLHSNPMHLTPRLNKDQSYIFSHPLGLHGCYRIKLNLFGAFTKLRKATISVVISVCPSVRMEKFDSLWGGFS